MSEGNALVEWLKEYRDVLEWVGGISVVLSVGSVLLLPWLVARVPDDYFDDDYERPDPSELSHPVARTSLRIARSLIGFLLVLAGVAMLVLPGQGVLAILAGIVLMEFPGKRRLELALARRPTVARALQWLRKKGGAAPLEGLAPR